MHTNSMDTLSQKLAEEAEAAPRSSTEERWQQHLARTTAILAVIAAMATARYGGAGANAILFQSKESDAWSYYQAKNIKLAVIEAQGELGQALAATLPGHWALELYTQQRAADAERLQRERQQLRDEAEKLQKKKERYTRQADRFELAFIALQVGVVLCSVAGAARRRWMWMTSIVLGVGGVVLVLNAFFLFI